MMSSMAGQMGMPFGAQGRIAQGREGQEEGQEGRTRADAAEGAQPAGRRDARHARRFPRPVADAQGPRRAAAGPGRHRPVEAEVPGQASSRDRAARSRARAARRAAGRVVDRRRRAERRAGQRRGHRLRCRWGWRWILPGLVDAHCHVGLGPHGAVDLDEAIGQAETERDVGALLLRDAGSPTDTRSLDDRHDLPRIIRAGRHLARPKRYSAGLADRTGGRIAAARRGGRAGALG